MNHLAEALDRMPQQMRDDPNAVALLEVLTVPIQQLEDAAMAVLNSRNIDLATGAQLDALGRVVGQARGGLDDATMRRYIRARGRANRSDGTREDLIAMVLSALAGLGARVRVTQGLGEVALAVVNIVTTDANAAMLIEFLRIGVAAGVRVQAHTLTVAPEAAFRFGGAAGSGFPMPRRLDLATVLTGGAGYDTVIGIRPHVAVVDAAALTLQFVDDGTGVGALDDAGPALVFHFEPGVTYMSDLEAALAASAWLYVSVASTVPVALLGDVAADNFGPINIITAGAPAVAGGALARAQE